MKKLIYLLVITIIFAACASKKDYIVTGSIEGGVEGGIVYLSFVEKGSFVNIDSSDQKRGIYFQGTTGYCS